MAKTAFVFRKALYLVEATPLRAASLAQLLTGVTLADELSVFYHLHRRFFVEPDALPEYPNDFAQWVGLILGQGVVAERLANLNLFRAPNLRELRREIAVIIADSLRRQDSTVSVGPEEAFIFCRPWLTVMPCGCEASTPEEFVARLADVEHDCIAYHLFAAKMRPEGGRNDFSEWFDALGHADLAAQLDSFDPYLNSLEDNRRYLCELVDATLPASRREDADA